MGIQGIVWVSSNPWSHLSKDKKRSRFWELLEMPSFTRVRVIRQK
jgi:hypothetical protein